MPEIAAGLRRRRRLVQLELALLLPLIGFLVAFALAPPTSGPSMGGMPVLLFALVSLTVLSVVALGTYLLLAPCPNCGQRFARRSIFNLFVSPAPGAFTQACGSCGVSLYADES
jgi:hypothetical protein